MTMIEAGARVARGYYFSGQSWTLRPMHRDGEALPGAPGEKYLRVPLPLAFALAPLMGAAFLVFLPLIGFYLAGHAAVRPVARMFTSSATEIAATVQGDWQPGAAHLTGHPAPRHEGEAAGAVEDPLADLEREIAALRSARRNARS